jgi:shikimate 5-dehydrogenase
MKNLLLMLAHLLATIAKLLGPGGAKAIVADSLLMKQQLLIINRSRRRAPNLSALGQFPGEPALQTFRHTICERRLPLAY